MTNNQTNDLLPEINVGPTPTHAGQGNGSQLGSNLQNIMAIPMKVQVVLGAAASMSVLEVSKIGRGNVIALNRSIGDPLDVTINGKPIARGHLIAIKDDKGQTYGISITELINSGGDQQG